MNQHRKRAELYNRGLCHGKVRACWNPSGAHPGLNGHEKPRGNGADLGTAGRAAVPPAFPGGINTLCVGEAGASLDLGGRGERGGRGQEKGCLPLQEQLHSVETAVHGYRREETQLGSGFRATTQLP